MKTSHHIPEEPPQNILSRFVCPNTPAATGWQQALAYLILDMPCEALEELVSHQDNGKANGETTALGLLAIEQGELLPPLDLAKWASEALRRHGWHETTFETALINFLEARSPENALALWECYEERIPLNPHYLHHLACAYAGHGNHEKALRVIASAALTHPQPANMLMDHDLRDVWSFNSEIQPAPEGARLLTSPGLQRMLSDAEAGRILRTVGRTTCEDIVPAKVKPWMHRTLSSYYHLRPDCSADIRAAYGAWLEELRNQKVAELRRAIANAQAVVNAGRAKQTT